VLVALASATAIAILMPAGPDDGCPSPRQVSEAVNAHLPSMVLPLGRPPGPGVLRLSVTADAAGTLRVDLSDPDGGPLLRRRVAPEIGPRAKATDCAALAETAALIVDRYWHEVGYEVPPAPPPAPPPPKAPPPPRAAPPPAPEKAAPRSAVLPAPRETTPTTPEVHREPPRPPAWWVAAGAAGEVADRGSDHWAGSLAMAVERPRFGQRLGLRFTVEALNPDTRPLGGGKAAMVQVPVAMDAYLAVPVGLGRLEPSIGGGLTVTVVAYPEGQSTKSRVIGPPAVNAGLAWAVPVARDFFFRLAASGVVASPYRIDADPQHIFDTPRFRAEFGLELGVWFH
jgi:hypothetical protein